MWSQSEDQSGFKDIGRLWRHETHLTGAVGHCYHEIRLCEVKEKRKECLDVLYNPQLHIQLGLVSELITN